MHFMEVYTSRVNSGVDENLDLCLCYVILTGK
jgi:hypothetical protein